MSDRIKSLFSSRSLDSNTTSNSELGDLSTLKYLLDRRNAATADQIGHTKWFKMLRWIAVIATARSSVFAVYIVNILPAAVGVPLLTTVAGCLCYSG